MITPRLKTPTREILPRIVMRIRPGILRHLFPAITLVAALMLASCTSRPVIEQDTSKVPVEVQEEKAERSFASLLTDTQRMRRVEKRDILIDGFREIIEKYPDSSIAHESHFHLIRHLLYDYEIPREAEAENVRGSYYVKYRHSGLKIAQSLDFEIAKYYYQFRRWNKLVEFTIPYMQEYVDTGRMRDGLYMFYYSEARFNLADYDEALRGFVTFVNMYPENSMVGYVRDKITQIDHLKKQGVQQRDQ